MAYATSSDVVAALGRSLTAAESVSVSNQLEQATDLVAAYLGNEPDPVPGAVARVVATMVAAVFSKPSITVADYDASGYSTAREAAGVYVGTESATTSGPWLTNALRERLKPYRVSMRAVTVISEYGS
jgi:hypothetical protein